MDMHPHSLQRHPFPIRGPPPLIPAEDDTDDAGPSSIPDAASDTDMGTSNSRPEYLPSALDVLVTKAMLAKGLHLPLEVVDLVVDFAEYWPHTTTRVERPSRPNRFGTRPDVDDFLLRTPPLGFLTVPHPEPERYVREGVKVLRISDEHPVEQFQKWVGSPVAPVQLPCRKIVFTIRSRDQGWGGETQNHNTYRGSWTWFEAGLERIDARGDCGEHCPDHQQALDQDPSGHPHIPICALRPIRPVVTGEDQYRTNFNFELQPAEDKVQCNQTAHSAYITHVVEWRATDDIDPSSAEADKLEEIGRGRASGTGEFVRNLKLGDVVTLWAKTRFQGWVNNVESATVDVYWAI